MNVLIVGCTYTGRRLAEKLDGLGHSVSIVDSEMSYFEKLRKGHNYKLVLGEETDADVLRKAGAQKADAAVIVTHKDNVNVMAAQIMNVIFSLENVYISLRDYSREEVFRKLGIRTVSATRIESDLLLSLVTDKAQEIEPVVIGGESISYSMVKADRKYFDCEASDVICKSDEMLFAVKKPDGSLHLANEPELLIEEGDDLVYAVI